MEKVRIIRIIVYEGDRKWVEETINKSIQGKFIVNPRSGKVVEYYDYTGEYVERSITAATIGNFPEILKEGGDTSAK